MPIELVTNSDFFSYSQCRRLDRICEYRPVRGVGAEQPALTSIPSTHIRLPQSSGSVVPGLPKEYQSPLLEPKSEMVSSRTVQANQRPKSDPSESFDTKRTTGGCYTCRIRRKVRYLFLSAMRFSYC